MDIDNFEALSALSQVQELCTLSSPAVPLQPKKYSQSKFPPVGIDLSRKIDQKRVSYPSFRSGKSQAKITPPGSTLTLKTLRKRLVCKFFLRGKCSRGDKCPYLHVTSDQSTGNLMERICRHHMLGKCRLGSSCRYLHDLSLLPCLDHHLKRNCLNPNCPFSHKPLNSEQAAYIQDKLQSDKTQSSETGDRMMREEYLKMNSLWEAMKKTLSSQIRADLASSGRRFR
ncbi:Protein suppressor of sable-like protein [Aduncisulcus paluster]|uniref:Protein suppressor of sable-like protein n=1 Tax=Aduncisulcus paluster TaxID=2918883 RepID=A0ABQ5K7G2_9EUKA|nr:Protein suppressor of sable-like protein [Aduncisulcus paluster]